MPDQELLKEIKRIMELTSRVDERVKSIVESDEKMADRLDKFMEQHNILAERVSKLEYDKLRDLKNEERISTLEDRQGKMNIKMVTIENTAPMALQIVNQSLEALNKLSDRVKKIEDCGLLSESRMQMIEDGTNVVKTWQKWVNWIGDWCFKIAWIIIAAYILSRIGLGGVNIPAPF